MTEEQSEIVEGLIAVALMQIRSHAQDGCGGPPACADCERIVDLVERWRTLDVRAAVRHLVDQVVADTAEPGCLWWTSHPGDAETPDTCGRLRDPGSRYCPEHRAGARR